MHVMPLLCMYVVTLSSMNAPALSLLNILMTFASARIDCSWSSSRLNDSSTSSAVMCLRK